MRLKLSPGKWWPFCHGLNVLIWSTGRHLLFNDFTTVSQALIEIMARFYLFLQYFSASEGITYVMTPYIGEALPSYRCQTNAGLKSEAHKTHYRYFHFMLIWSDPRPWISSYYTNTQVDIFSHIFTEVLFFGLGSMAQYSNIHYITKNKHTMSLCFILWRLSATPFSCGILTNIIQGCNHTTAWCTINVGHQTEP